MQRTASFSAAVLLPICLFATSAITAEKVRVASGGFTPLHSIIWAASPSEHFQKYGLETEYSLNSGTLGAQTLLAKTLASAYRFKLA